MELKGFEPLTSPHYDPAPTRGNEPRRRGCQSECGGDEAVGRIRMAQFVRSSWNPKSPSIQVSLSGTRPEQVEWRDNADACGLPDRGADRHEFDQTVADLGDVGLYADDVLRAQLIGFTLKAIDRHFACVVNETGQFADLAAREGLERR